MREPPREPARRWGTLIQRVWIFDWTLLAPESLMGISRFPHASAFRSLKWTFPTTLGQDLAASWLISCTGFGRCLKSCKWSSWV